MKHALFILHDFAGGAERCNLALLRAMLKAGIACRIACFSQKGFFRDQVPADVPVLCLPTLWNRARSLPGLTREANLVIAGVELQSHVRSALLAPDRCVLQYHKSLRHYLAGKGRLFGAIYRLAVAWSLRRCRKAICVSRDIQDFLRTLWPGVCVRLKCLPNFYDSERVLDGIDDPLPPDLANFFDAPIILGVGRLNREKNFGLLVKAFRIVRQAGLPCKLCILGEGPERAALEKMLQRLGLERQALLPGSMPPYAAMRQAAVVCLSSDYEGFSTVLLEALALGCRIVATDAGGVRDILDHGRWGAVVPAGDAGRLAKALQAALLQADTAEDRQARMKYAQTYSREQVIPLWLSAHLEALQ